jgi:hypothetical protein
MFFYCKALAFTTVGTVTTAEDEVRPLYASLVSQKAMKELQEKISGANRAGSLRSQYTRSLPPFPVRWDTHCRTCTRTALLQQWSGHWYIKDM